LSKATVISCQELLNVVYGNVALAITSFESPYQYELFLFELITEIHFLTSTTKLVVGDHHIFTFNFN